METYVLRVGQENNLGKKIIFYIEHGLRINVFLIFEARRVPFRQRDGSSGRCAKGEAM